MTVRPVSRPPAPFQAPIAGSRCLERRGRTADRANCHQCAPCGRAWYKRDGVGVSAPVPSLTTVLEKQNQWLIPRIAERRCVHISARGMRRTQRKPKRGPARTVPRNERTPGFLPITCASGTPDSVTSLSCSPSMSGGAFGTPAENGSSAARARAITLWPVLVTPARMRLATSGYARTRKTTQKLTGSVGANRLVLESWQRWLKPERRGGRMEERSATDSEKRWRARRRQDGRRDIPSAAPLCELEALDALSRMVHPSSLPSASGCDDR